MALTWSTERSIASSSSTSSFMIASVPWAEFLSACSAVAFSGLRAVAITKFSGDSSRHFVNSSPIPREQLWSEMHVSIRRAGRDKRLLPGDEPGVLMVGRHIRASRVVFPDVTIIEVSYSLGMRRRFGDRCGSAATLIDVSEVAGWLGAPVGLRVSVIMAKELTLTSLRPGL